MDMNAEALTELVKEWRAKAERMRGDPPNPSGNIIAAAFERCAKDLESELNRKESKC